MSTAGSGSGAGVGAAGGGDSELMAVLGLPSGFGARHTKRRRKLQGHCAGASSAAATRQKSAKRSSEGSSKSADGDTVPWPTTLCGAAGSASGAVLWLTRRRTTEPEWGKLLVRSESEERFCKQAVCGRIQKAKESFSGVTAWAFRRARAATNPYEALGSGPYLNRSAMKLANMDGVLGLVKALRTNAGDRELGFVDLCGGPGGFTEYLMSCGNIRGFGMTLTEAAGAHGCAWKLDHVPGVCSEADSGHGTLSGGRGAAVRVKDRGGAGATAGAGALVKATASGASSFVKCFGHDGTGDLYNVKNQEAFAAKTREAWPAGVDLVVADGGFLAARDRHDQELVMYRLVVCQVAAMLRVIRTGGTFVCKLFDAWHPSTVGVLFLLHTVFTKFTLIKPPTSRPASSERYVICTDFCASGAGRDAVLAHLLSESERAAASSPKPSECGVDVDLMLSDHAFCEHVKLANESIGQQQAEACETILRHCEAPIGTKRTRRGRVPVPLR